MAPKIIILAGAPESHSLDWEESGLLKHFTEPIAHFTRSEHPLRQPVLESNSSPTPDLPVWRSIPLHRQRLPTGFSQILELGSDYHGYKGLFTTLTQSLDNTSILTGDDQSQKLLNEFYDRSLALHEELPSSQLPGSSFGTDISSIDETREGSTDFSTQGSGSSGEQSHVRAIESGHLSDLEDLPKASYLQSISPQTITVNLIVGIISVAEPRTVKTRWGSTKSLVELLVADDTKSGFAITFWLSSDLTESDRVLKDLRRQDIVLLRNVALNVFMKKVYGHSLRKGLTKVDLLHRRRLDTKDQPGLYSMKDVVSKRPTHPQLAKTRKVREWVLHFVGGGATSLRKRKHNGKPVRTWDMPPEDTQ
ncbi:Uu.00g126460.m01.CDS01 [Anthostomella pinea]|uniref:Uu.00g126460.m01.CDS01 n=1 Tax=Anthostomella pinea TaxID=933095 RepID=A0AAI8YHX7_9PEZI|nr:Uu.00g126460.m01.CDS01 [Anthostomella pinea]